MADEEPVNGISDENSEKSQQKRQAKYDSEVLFRLLVTFYIIKRFFKLKFDCIFLGKRFSEK